MSCWTGKIIGKPGCTTAAEIPDRRAAILRAVELAVAAGPSATLAVVGKGHESGQEIDGVVHPFDNRVELRQALEQSVGGHR